VTITVTPQPGTHGDVYQLQWQEVTYDDETETWQPVTEPAEPSPIAKLGAKLRGIFTWTRPIVQYAMPTFDIDSEQINVFEINDTYLFKAYFDNDDLFKTLQQYYNADAYRFELPTDHDTLQHIDDILAEHFYTLNVVEDPEPYCVVMDRNDDHSNILRNTVVKFERGQHNVFLLKDQLSVDQAIEHGATRVTESDTRLPRDLR